MKSALTLVFLFTFAFASPGIVHQHCNSESDTHDTSVSIRTTTNNDVSTSANGGWGQAHSGNASFTQYSGCSSPSCGIQTYGYTAAVNTFAFGAYSASGDACGRCFKITSNEDPYSTSYSGPFNSIVVRVNNLCPIDGNEEWCGQTVSHPLNQFGMSMHFDLCQDSGTGTAFFPEGRAAMLGTFVEVLCEDNWSGSEGGSLWNGSCMANDTTPLWPGRGCGNQGTPPQ
ncbi:endoglucanase V-like protein [Russula emetica]|nr:endoglucanase V-like protein [Russula emetica]